MSLEALECIRVARGPVSEITISRPKALNALNRQVLRELAIAVETLRADESVRCLILTGDGAKAFVAGADIAEMSRLSPAAAEDFAGQGQALFRAIENFPAPVIAAVNGFALGGGCELVLACDLVYAAENAKFGQPEVKLGLMPGFGGTVRLPRKIGPGAAREWIYTGEVYSAEAAKRVGLVQEIYPQDQLLGKVRGTAQLIAKRAPLAVRACKRVLSQDTDTAVATELERWSFGQLFASADTREGTSAFVEKRDPTFKGA